MSKYQSQINQPNYLEHIAAVAHFEKTIKKCTKNNPPK
jgi:hypothetical protein